MSGRNAMDAHWRRRSSAAGPTVEPLSLMLSGGTGGDISPGGEGGSTLEKKGAVDPGMRHSAAATPRQRAGELLAETAAVQGQAAIIPLSVRDLIITAQREPHRCNAGCLPHLTETGHRTEAFPVVSPIRKPTTRPDEAYPCRQQPFPINITQCGPDRLRPTSKTHSHDSLDAHDSCDTLLGRLLLLLTTTYVQPTTCTLASTANRGPIIYQDCFTKNVDLVVMGA
ncbi:hypothetical protein LX32DRAFT_220652 [Colletotrichum zoysiae]|uniref:Uncharacterized protein n=1 Tax=Colletotrichum zoysiae TaxID=1216348 RepID=A0AAD9H3Y4_9PEZI|nr:hypothetical protein LX32DRAFT_220652 [Colletotrichum zoysiae]